MTGGKKIADALNEAMAWAEGHDTGAVLHHAPPAAPCADEVEALFPVADAARSKHLRVDPNDQMGALGAALEAALAELAHLRQAERERAWRPIETAPRDGTLVWAYTSARDGLPAFQSPCAYHHDAGWCCTDELRHVTHWMPITDVWLPPPPVPGATR